MSGFLTIRNDDICASLKETTRQYFAGNLKNPQLIKHIFDDKIEIGFTSYDSYNEETPHKHSVSTEYQYVISGWTEYINTETKEVFRFVKGDFYAILPNTSYAQKSRPGTKILFIKNHSINDKINLDVEKEIESWFSNKLKSQRTDYYFETNAPKPNSIHPAAAVALLNSNNEILLLHRRDNDMWTMPGGTIEFGESLSSCAIREVKEECGYDVIVTDVIGIYTNPNILVGYVDGEVRQEFTVVYKGEIVGGVLQIDNESYEGKWINIDEISDLSFAKSQRIRIEDVIHFTKFGKYRNI